MALSPQSISRFIGTGNPLASAGGAQMLLRATGGNLYGAAMLAALARKESSFGAQAFVPNNFWGYGIHAGPSVNRAPTVEAMAKRVWGGLTSPTGYYKGAKTAGQAINIYAPPSENDTGLYKSQVNQWLASMGADPAANFRGGARAAAPASGQGTPGPALPGGGAMSAGLTGASLAAIQDYARQSQLDVMAGLEPADVMPVASALQYQPISLPDPATVAAAPRQAAARLAGVADAPAGPAGTLTRILPGMGGGYSTSGDPEGQSGGHRAVNWFAKHGTPVRAPINGRVVRITPHSGPGSGQVFGGTLSIRGSDGRLYVMRHIDPQRFSVGTQVRAGQHVGTPTAWTGGSHHIHFEIYPTGGSDREYSTRALNPATQRWA